jgi:hypothetical protein
MSDLSESSRRTVSTDDTIPLPPQYGEPVPPPPVTTHARVPEVVHEIERDTYRGWRDRVGWGPVLAGLVVTIGTYLVLQLALVTSGLVEIPDRSDTAGAWSAAAAVVAFVLGGITAGASAASGRASDGVLHGIVMWAVALVALVLLAGIGSGVALGALDTRDVFDDLTTNADTAQTQQTARDAAGWALIGLSVAMAAAAIGGAIGSKLWPRDDDGTVETRRR